MIGISSCRHAAVIPVDTLPISYSHKISNIIIANCTSACHEHTEGGNRSFIVAGSDTVLDTNKLKIYIQAGSPAKSKFYTAIVRLANPMPPSGPMPEGDIIQIYTWIKEGATYSN